MSGSATLTVRCPVCGARPRRAFFEVSNVPVHVGRHPESALEAADAPCGDIRLGHCGTCGLIWNLLFDADRVLYDERYDNSLGYSHHQQAHAEQDAAELVDRYALRQRHILDISRERGAYLRALCELGDNRGISVGPEDSLARRLDPVAADVVICRFVLEHVADPVGFLGALRRSVDARPEVLIHVEVPSVAPVLHQRSIWDVIYEHCSYFNAGSLVRAFERAGFEVRDLRERQFGQVLAIDAQPAAMPAASSDRRWNDLRADRTAVDGFLETYRAVLDRWQRWLAELVTAGRRAVVWGAGAKGTTFLNQLAVRDEIQHVVDINPNKVGRYIPCTGQEIVAPSALRALRPDVVLVMNRIYEPEIRRDLQRLGVSAELVAV